MQIVIDIDEDTYKDIKRGKIYSSVRDVPYESVVAIANGIPLPDNATNGDIIKAMFPNTTFTDRKFAIEWKDNDGLISVFGDTDWWNAPYKGGKE